MSRSRSSMNGLLFTILCSQICPSQINAALSVSRDALLPIWDYPATGCCRSRLVLPHWPGQPRTTSCPVGVSTDRSGCRHCLIGISGSAGPALIKHSERSTDLSTQRRAERSPAHVNSRAGQTSYLRDERTLGGIPIGLIFISRAVAQAGGPAKHQAASRPPTETVSVVRGCGRACRDSSHGLRARLFGMRRAEGLLGARHTPGRASKMFTTLMALLAGWINSGRCHVHHLRRPWIGSFSQMMLEIQVSELVNPTDLTQHLALLVRIDKETH